MGRRGGLGIVSGAVLAGALLTACSPQPAAEATPSAETARAAVHPESGLKVIPLTVTSKGREHRFRVELADTPNDQQMGLMFRTELGPDEGMIFPSTPPSARSFWMKNTPLPLDIIFIGVDGRILNVAAMTTPYSLESIASSGITRGVLELAGGRAAELGIGPGDLVEW